MYTGILRYADIGAGGWQLECSDGKTYTLYGEIPPALKNKKVQIQAKPMQGMGFMMSGEMLSVESISAV